VAFIFYNQILHFLQEPLCAAAQRRHKGCTFLVTAPLDGLTLRNKDCLLRGILAASPVLFWQLWRFITPGLKPQNASTSSRSSRRHWCFFISGMTVAYFSFRSRHQFLESIGGKSLLTEYKPQSSTDACSC